MSDSSQDPKTGGHQFTKAPDLLRRVMYKLGFRHPGFEFEDDPSNSGDE